MTSLTLKAFMITRGLENYKFQISDYKFQGLIFSLMKVYKKLIHSTSKDGPFYNQRWETPAFSRLLAIVLFN